MLQGKPISRGNPSAAITRQQGKDFGKLAPLEFSGCFLEDILKKNRLRPASREVEMTEY